MERTRCPVCDGAARHIAASAQPWQCDACGHRLLGRASSDPVPLASREAIQARAARLASLLSPHGRCLDLHPRGGSFLAEAHALGLQVAGVQPDPLLRVQAAAGLSWQVYASLDEASPFTPADSATLWEVLQAEPEPLDLLKKTASLVGRGGILGVSVLVRDSLAAMHSFGKASLRLVLLRAGCEVIRCDHTGGYGPLQCRLPFQQKEDWLECWARVL